MLISPRGAFQICVAGLLATLGFSLAALLCAWGLPRAPVSGPIGATCPDTSSGVAGLQTGLAITAIAAAAVAVAGAISAAARGHHKIGGAMVAVAASLLPYLGIIGWLIPRLCDYT